MKSAAEIEARIGELNLELLRLVEPVSPQAGRAAKLYRLQGEISALEWALEVVNA